MENNTDTPKTVEEPSSESPSTPCCASWDLIIRVLFEILPDDWMPDNPTRETRLREDIGLDSLDFVEAFMVLEEKLQRELPDDAGENWKTLGDVLDYLHNNLL